MTNESTVLYIDDSPLNLKLMERVLERLPSVRLETAESGAAGIQLASAIRPDLILLDLYLPDMSGHAVLAQLRLEPATREIPVFVVSGESKPAEIAAMKAEGADEFLAKPLDIPRFLELVRERLEAKPDGSGESAGRERPDSNPRPPA